MSLGAFGLGLCAFFLGGLCISLSIKWVINAVKSAEEFWDY